MRVCYECVWRTDEETCIGIVVASGPCERCKLRPPKVVVKPGRQSAWEERWNLSGGIWWGAWPPAEPTDEERAHNAARMQLAECAPEMYRMIVRLDEARNGRRCFSCATIDSTHREGCEVERLLKRARGEKPDRMTLLGGD